MRALRKRLAPVWSNPVARCLLAAILFAASLGGLSLTAYSDQLENGGIAYERPAELIPFTDVNPLGANTFLEKEVEPENVVRTLDMVQAGGFKWIRQVFPWNDIEISEKGNFTDTRHPERLRSAWEKYDFIVDEAVKRDINIIARLDSPPTWARFPGDDLEKYHKGPPARDEDYADFVRAVAERYKGKVRYFQVWNEPNLEGEWGGYGIDPQWYTRLLKAAYEAIKQANPEAVVISAALAPTTENSLKNLNDVLFLEGMYEAGAKPYFDIFSTMLYGLGQPPDERRVDLKRLSFSRPILLRQVMERHGDGNKPIWISEYNWVSLPPGWEEEKAAAPEEEKKFWGTNIWGESVDEQTQARWLVEGYERVRREWPWMGVMNVWFFRDPTADPRQPASWFSIVRPDFVTRPAYTALQEYSVTLSAERPTVQKPPWNAVGFPFLYGVFGLMALASAAWGLGNLGRWPGAALDIPRGRYRETAREVARNGVVVVLMALLGGLYYGIQNVPLALLVLAGWGLLAFLKPSTALAAVAFTIPFSWQPKILGSNKFPLAETLLLVTFGAVVARHAVRRFVPRLAAWLRIYDYEPGHTEMDLRRWMELQGAAPGEADAEGSELGIHERITEPNSWGRADGNGWLTSGTGSDAIPKSTLPLEDEDDDGEMEPATWPSRPRPVRFRYFSGPLPKAAFSVPAQPRTQVQNTPASVTTAATTATLPAATAELGTEASARVTLPIVKATQPIERPTLPVLDEAPAMPPAAPGTQPLLPLRAQLWARFKAWDQEDAFAPPAVLLLVLGLLSLLWVADPTFITDSARQFRWVIIEPVLYYFLLTEVIKNRRSLLRLADFFMAGAVVVALVGIVQYVQGSGTLVVEGVSRLTSVYTHPNNLGLFLGRATPFAACLAIFLPWGWRKLVYAGLTLPLALTLLLTFSRGAWAGAAAGVVAALVVGFRYRQGRMPTTLTRRTWGILAGAAVALMIAGALVYPYLPERVKGIGSGFIRLNIWESALRMGADHPVLGVGLDQFFNQYHNKYVAPEQRDDPSTPQVEGESYTSHPHNLVLDYWLNLGIMGLFVLVWLLQKYFWVAINRVKTFADKMGADPVGRAMSLGLLALMVDFLVHGLIDNSYFLMDLALVFWLSCAMLQIMRKT
ncbi:MAG: O-antigen ligase family protein [Chloroflexota bacterium]|nr:O-antigen ligase family protein [Chloroflexota bacterium]